MLRFILSLAGVELDRALRRAAGTAILFAIGALLLGGALVALLVALFIALADAYDPVVAALLIAAISFIGATVLLILGYARLRRPAPRPGYGFNPLAGLGPVAPPPTAAPLTGELPPSTPRVGSGTILGIAAGAALLGLILGRRI
ncbi:phage holin family protein [Ancylobacter sp. A5.8]|uniref:phage holin family protein n=1 Tax=Ancylobacter gelatini TaxID=2919920 RepID=UPI001F4E7DEA|nr:phage holin family protein [Ancylobacter gelatini]MCJ8143531.1 phage holin family protein [Ancylobacter gelatini]